MTDKNNIESLIATYLSGKATDVEKEILEAWVKETPENARYFQKEKNIRQTLYPAFDPANIDTEKAEKKLSGQIGRLNPTRKILLYWQRIAAILIIPLMILSAWLYWEGKDSFYQDTEYQELVAPHGMHSQVNLPDGSKVWLNGGSTLRYPVNFKRGKRNVTLSGEGYFEVQSDQKNPFTVTTEQITLTATGTIFSIEAYDTDPVTSVTMVEGKVNVASNHSASPANQPESIAMKPGERACFNKLTSKYERIETTDLYKWYAWKDGVMIFRDDPLSYVFKRLALTFNIDIDLKDEELASSPYRATFEIESLDEILRLLEMSAPLSFVYGERAQTANNTFAKQRIEVYKRDTPYQTPQTRRPVSK